MIKKPLRQKLFFCCWKTSF